MGRFDRGPVAGRKAVRVREDGILLEGPFTVGTVATQRGYEIDIQIGFGPPSKNVPLRALRSQFEQLFRWELLWAVSEGTRKKSDAVVVDAVAVQLSA